MKVRLNKPARIWHKAGDIVEVSPAELLFLESVEGCEIVVEETIETPEEKPVVKKATTSRKK